MPTRRRSCLAPQARFTLLTERLIRLEYSPDGVFEDHPSQAFWYRRQPVPNYEVRQAPDGLEIETEYLLLRYRPPGHGFTPNSLSVLVKATGQTWYFGDRPWRGGNLFGTARTLDEAGGAVRLEPGLMARGGWAAVDDSNSLVFNESGWLESAPASRKSATCISLVMGTITPPRCRNSAWLPAMRR